MKKDRFVTVITYLFMTIEAALMGLTILLFSSLSGSIDNLVNEAKTPDFLQMHAGAIDIEEIDGFADSIEGVLDWQICGFLNIDNSIISIGDVSLSENTQDNGLCIQNEVFDYLITTDGSIPVVDKGTVYIPICYKNEYKISVGDIVSLGDTKLSVAGFVRDSQMNSMMASSKRFLVCEDDYKLLKEIGSEEYLIEFLMKDGYDVNNFATEYSNANLPANGPTITLSLIKLMNTLSDGMMIFVILLVSVVILVISILCIRFILITTLEKDKPEIGMMKAIGISRVDIRRIYFNKYVLLAVIGSFSGLVIAFALYKPLSSQMRELYGASYSIALAMLESLVGVVIVEGVLLWLIHRILKQIERLSAVQILQKRSDKEKGKKKQYILISIITAASLFLAVVPFNILSTISADKFVTYMGIGNAQVRLDIRQSEDILDKTKIIDKELKDNVDIESYVILQTRMMNVILDDKLNHNLLIEWGDHEEFPLTYVEGRAPLAEHEIALSALNSEELCLGVGDKLSLIINEKIDEYVVCGVYSDITNGGKTAKAYDSGELFADSDKPIMWSVIYLSLKENVDVENWISSVKDIAETNNISIKITDIPSYVQATYSQTISQIKSAAVLSIISGMAILWIVVLLFMRMIVETDRKDIAFKKAIGFRTRDIKIEYIVSAGRYVLTGAILGILLGIYLGQMICGMIFSSFGISKFKMIINYVAVTGLLPLLFITVAFGAILITIRKIRLVEVRETLS